MKRHTKPTALELLPFRIGEHEYAIDVLQVRQIRPPAHITPVAADNPRIRGAIDVSGVLVPVVDLRETTERIDEATVIVVAIARRLVAIAVDTVCRIVELLPPQVRPAPGLALRAQFAFAQGVVPVDGRLLIVPDVAELIAARMAQAHPTYKGE